MTPASATLPIGPLVESHPAKRPERVTVKGRWVTLVPLDAAAHAEALYEGSNGDAKREAVWTYLFDGPYGSLDEFRANIEAKAHSADPLFFAVIDNSSGRAVGYQTFLRIDPPNRVIEVGNIMYTPAIQRTAGATEAQFLFAKYVSTSSAIAVTNGSATPSTRRRGAPRSALASRSRGFSAST